MILNRKDNEIKHRVFLVGCPRSGTTLLQSLIASHPDILSFPESHFFEKLYPRYEPRRKLLRLASRQAKLHVEKFLSKIGYPTPNQTIHFWTVFQRQYTYQFIKALDALTLAQEKSIWLEKTPDHLFHIGTIENSIENVKFIHILRNGPDVIASLYQVTQQYPQYWGGSWSIDKCISKWMTCIQETEKYSHKQNHIKIFYENILAEPDKNLRTICQWLNIPFSKAMLSKRQRPGGITEKYEFWKANIQHEVKRPDFRKFDQLFSSEEKSYILDKLSNSKP